MTRQLVEPKVRRSYPRIATVTALHQGGCAFHVASDAENFRVERFGGEEEFTRMILDDLRPGEVLLDIGACIGFVTVHAAARGARVVAFEPDPGFRARLEENLRLNDLATVAVLPWAVSNERGTAVLYTEGIAGCSPSLRIQGDRWRVTVETNRIDDGIAGGTFPPPQVVKIDVEGAETRVVMGMSELLASPRRPRSIYVELHPNFLAELASSVEEVDGMLRDAGYVVTYDVERFDQIHRVYRYVER